MRVCVFAGCQTHCGAPGKGCECTIGQRAGKHACTSAENFFAASGGICVANVITAVQLEDDRIKLLLKGGGGQGRGGVVVREEEEVGGGGSG